MATVLGPEGMRGCLLPSKQAQLAYYPGDNSLLALHITIKLEQHITIKLEQHITVKREQHKTTGS